MVERVILECRSGDDLDHGGLVLGRSVGHDLVEGFHGIGKGGRVADPASGLLVRAGVWGERRAERATIQGKEE